MAEMGLMAVLMKKISRGVSQRNTRESHCHRTLGVLRGRDDAFAVDLILL
jgi:hypothetical protein